MVNNLKFLWIPLALLAVLYASNQHLGWNEGLSYLQCSDAETAYIPIAQSAPSLPSKALVLHHAQRFFWPFVVGSVAKLTHISYENCFYFFSFAFMAGICWCFFSFLSYLQVNGMALLLPFSLLVFNPYIFRYYLIVPSMLSDLGCVLFTALALFFLCKKNLLGFYYSLIFSLFSRQTILIQVPVFIFWFFFADAAPVNIRIRNIFFTLATATGIYFLLSKVASSFSYASQNLDTVTAIFSYLGHPALNFKNIAELILRSFLPVLIPVAWISILFGKRRKSWNSIPKEFYLLFLSALAAVAQPILGGPLTGKNAGRLGALGLLPMLMALVYLQKDSMVKISVKTQTLIVGLLFLGSFHHLYSQPHLPSVEVFLSLQIAVLIVVSLFFIFLPPSNRPL